MKILFSFLFTDAWRLLRSKAGRSLVWLLIRAGHLPRNQAVTLIYNGLRFKTPDALMFFWQVREIFVDESYAFPPRPNTTPIILDCGANIGTSVEFFTRRYPHARIVAYEADPATAELLRQNLIQNQNSNAELIQKAVWIDNQGIDFGSAGTDVSSVLATENVVRVPSVRLRDELLTHEVVDMLKIDIEGAEVPVLLDCADALGHVRHLFVEYHAYPGQPQTLPDLLTVLTEAGFRYYIDTAQHRASPLINRQFRGNVTMDLQLTIFAYR
jgi:FkbM family methyltransferase